jgi:hypothetical protein
MTLYIGVDIHARQQTVSYLDTEDGTTGQLELQHEGDDVKEFYRQFQGEVIVGIDACGYTNWFEELMEQLGHVRSWPRAIARQKSESSFEIMMNS